MKYLWYILCVPLGLWIGVRMAQGEYRMSQRATYFTDPVTGCQYVKFGSDEGLAPRLDKDGKMICHATLNQNQ